MALFTRARAQHTGGGGGGGCPVGAGGGGGASSSTSTATAAAAAAAAPGRSHSVDHTDGVVPVPSGVLAYLSVLEPTDEMAHAFSSIPHLAVSILKLAHADARALVLRAPVIRAAFLAPECSVGHWVLDELLVPGKGMHSGGGIQKAEYSARILAPASSFHRDIKAEALCPDEDSGDERPSLFFEYCASLSSILLENAESQGLHPDDGDVSTEGENLAAAIAALPDLVSTLLDLPKAERGRIFDTYLMALVLGNPDSVGPWVVDRFRCVDDRERVAGAVEWCELVSERGRLEPARRKAVRQRVAGLANFLPSLLELPDVVQERVASTDVVAGVIDAMLTRPLTMLVIMIDGLALVLGLVVFTVSSISLVKNPTEVPEARIGVCLGVLFVVTVYLCAREISQARAMHRIGLFSVWYGELWNVIDVSAVVGVFLFLHAAITGQAVNRADYFQNLAASTAVFLWAKVLGFLKVSWEVV